MRIPGLVALTLALAPALFAQEEGSGKYVNKELGVRFAGVYGWEAVFAEGSGAWTELCRYSDASLDAYVVLLVRDNPYETSADLRQALEAEFKEGGDPAAGKPVYKEVSLVEADMKKGNKLAGFDVEAFVVRINEEGKKREHKLVVRTYFGRNRLFRVYCSVGRARAKRVRDLFERATASLVVTAKDEQTIRGVTFNSARGRYTCVVPEGFTPLLPPANWNTDMRFVTRRGGVSIDVYSYGYDGILADHVEEMADHYGEKITFEKEEADVFGGTGFLATVTTDRQTTLICGLVLDRRVYRIHTSAPKDRVDEAKRIHAAFQKGFRILRR